MPIIKQLMLRVNGQVSVYNDVGNLTECLKSPIRAELSICFAIKLGLFLVAGHISAHQQTASTYPWLFAPYPNYLSKMAHLLYLFLTKAGCRGPSAALVMLG